MYHKKVLSSAAVLYYTSDLSEVWFDNGKGEGLGGQVMSFLLFDGSTDVVVGPNVSTAWFLERAV